MKPLITRVTCTLSLLGAVALTACLEPGEFVYGDFLSEGPFVPFDESAGIHPSQAALEDPNNPFRLAGVGFETLFQIQASGNPVAAYYSWATFLTAQPTGEAQFFVGANLQEIWLQGIVPLDADGQPDPTVLETVRQMAVDAYTTVLEEFPDAATFDVTGTQRFELATNAFQNLVSLGGTPPPGWLLVEGDDGITRAVRQ